MVDLLVAELKAGKTAQQIAELVNLTVDDVQAITASPLVQLALSNLTVTDK